MQPSWFSLLVIRDRQPFSFPLSLQHWLPYNRYNKQTKGIFMTHMKGVLIIFANLMIGNLITALLGLAIPGSIIGMLLLLFLLLTKVVPLEAVESPANFLISIMVLMFIPGGVNLMNVYHKFDGVLLQVLFIVVITTIVTIAVTALVTDLLIKGKNKADKT